MKREKDGGSKYFTFQIALPLSRMIIFKIPLNYNKP